MIEGPNYIFVENPKTGTSAVRDYLMAHCGGKESTRYPNRHQHLDMPQEKFVFCGWRNPMDRLFSAYRHKMSSYPDMTFTEWLRDVRTKYGYDIQMVPQIVYAQYVNDFLWYDEGLRPEFNRILRHLGYDPMSKPQLEVRNKSPELDIENMWQDYHKAQAIARDRGLLVDICKRYC